MLLLGPVCCCVVTGACELMLCCYWGLCVVVLIQGSVS